MRTSEHRGAAHDLRQLIAAIFAIPVVVGLMLAAFAWPAARLAPRNLPIGVAGPTEATDAIAQRLAQREGAFAVHRYADEAAARAAIKDREIYGAIIAAPGGQMLLTASAASPLVAQLLEQAAGSLASGVPNGAAPRVMDVVPSSTSDPRGAALGASVLPLVLAGAIIGGIMALVGRAWFAQIGGLVGASLLTGLVAVGVAQGWLGVIGGNWLANAGVFGLTVLAIASVVAGLEALLGFVGLGLAAALMVFIGNPFSAVSSAPELLPKPVGVIGQLLPPGAGGNLLRSTAFFDGGGAGGHLAVLVVWAALGLGAVWVGRLRRRHIVAAIA